MIRRLTAFLLCLALAAGLFGVLPISSVLAACANNSNTEFRSVATADWSSTGTWECSDDGSNWEAATVTPSDTHGLITVRSIHSVAVTAAVTVDQVLVEAGGQVTVGSGIGWTIANGTGIDLTVNGTVLNSGLTLFSSSGPTWAVNNGGTYIHNTSSGISTPLHGATLHAASSFVYRGATGATPAVSMSGRTYGNLSFESTAGIWSTSLSGSSVATVQGQFTLGSGVTINNSSFVGWSIDGTWTNNGTFNAGTGTVTFNGNGSDQTISGSSVTAFNNLTINGIGGGAGSNSVVAIPTTNTPTVAGTLTNNGVLKQTRDVSSSAEFLRITNGSGTDKYRGVDFASSTSLGSTTVKVYGNQNTSGALGFPVNRWYQIDPTNAGTANLTFHFLCSELQTGQTPANLKVWRYNGSGWDELGNNSNSGATCSGTGSVTVNSVSLSADEQTYVLKINDPTAITLAEFFAEQVGDFVRVTWETASELDNLGFNLWRGTSPAGPNIRLNDLLIPSQSLGNPGGFVYTWDDQADLVHGTTYYYWLEDVDVNGVATMHGPVSVDFSVVPTAVTLSGIQASPAAAAPRLPWLWAAAGASAALGARRLRRRRM